MTAERVRAADPAPDDVNGMPVAAGLSGRITLREWLTAGRDLAVTVVVTLAVIAAQLYGLVGLATLAIERGWAR